MVSVVFHFTDLDPMHGLGSQKNYIKEWIYNAMVFGCDKVIMIDSTDLKIGKYYTHYSSDIGYEYYESLIDMKLVYPQNEFVWIFLESEHILSDEIKDVVDLNDLIHPINNVLYVFGPDFSSIEYSDYYNSKFVFFRTCKNKPLYSIPSSAIVLYDRFLKKSNPHV